MQRRNQVAASNRKTGAVLSAVGGVLAVAALAWVIVGGRAAEHSDADGGLALPGIVAFFAAVALIPGEQLRRGRFSFAGDDEDGAVRSQFRTLPVGIHVGWLGAGLALSALLVGAPVVSWFTGGWPHADRDGDGFSLWWVSYGSLVFGVTCAVAVSLVKKLVVIHNVGRPTPPPSRFWRWFGYRWRFDVWLGGVGGLLIAVSFSALPVSSDDDSGSTPVFVVLLAIGLLLLVLGAVTGTQFRRAGEALGSGEGIGDWRTIRAGRAAQRRLEPPGTD